MGNKRSSGKRLMCVLCASLQSIVGTSLARDKRVNYRGSKFQFLNMGGIPVSQKEKKGFIRGAIETFANHPLLSAICVAVGGDILVKGGELAWKRGIQPLYLKWFGFPEYYGYLYNCFNLAYGRISKIFAVCKKNDSLSAGIGKVLDKLCGEGGVYDSKTGKLSEAEGSQELKKVELEDVNELDGALFLLSEIFSTGEMKNNEYYYDVIQNLKKIVPGCSVHNSYKKIDGVDNLDSEKISSRVVADEKFGWCSRFAAGYGKFKQKLPFNPFPLIYLIRKYIVTKCLPADHGAFVNVVSCDKVNMSKSNSFVKDYDNVSEIKIGRNENDIVKENYFSLSRTGDKLTIVFWLSTSKEGEYVKDSEAKKVECTYTVPGGKEILDFDKRWEKPKFVNDSALKYNASQFG